jgi:hypothetical protein
MDEPFLTFVACAVAIAIVFFFFIILPADIAYRRNRSSFGWVLFSLIFSPILAVILLAALGLVSKPSNE